MTRTTYPSETETKPGTHCVYMKPLNATTFPLVRTVNCSPSSGYRSGLMLQSCDRFTDYK